MGGRTTKLNSPTSKSGEQLSQIGKLNGLTIDEVKERLVQATGLTPETLRIILNIPNQDKALREEYWPQLEVLKQVLTDPQEATKQKTVAGFEAWIEALAYQGKGLHEISRLLEVSVRAVLTYTLGSPDDRKTYSRSPAKTTEETKEPPKPQPTRTLSRPQSSHPSFLYSCHKNTSKLQRVNLLTGEVTYFEVSSYQFKFGCRWSELPGGSLSPQA
jgi:hypothetical protein